MIPVLGIPILSRPQDLATMLASVDEPVGRLVIVDNGGVVPPDFDWPGEYVVIDAGHNLGYAASVNLILKSTPAAPWWAIANADIVLAPGDLARIATQTAQDGPQWVGIVDWRIYGLNAECLATVGFWDENFVPAFCEDADYEYRCTLAGVPWRQLDGATQHIRSVTLQESRYAQGNARSYPANRAYYAAKWGGDLRGGERFQTPFDQGGSVADWTLDPTRLRDLAW